MATVSDSAGPVMPGAGAEVRVVRAGDLAAALAAMSLQLDDAGDPREPLLFVDLDDAATVAADTAGAARQSPVVLIGLAWHPVPAALAPLTEALTCTLVCAPAITPAEVAVADIRSTAAAVAAAVRRSPRAAMTLAGLLRLTATLPVAEGLLAESLAYSMLLAGDEFRRWRSSRPARFVPDRADPAVLLTREDHRLTVTINRPDRHNAFDRDVRDGLVEAFDLVAVDPTIEHAVLRGAGRSFCSGGDLDEFGSADDVSLAHLVRIDRSVAARLYASRDRVEVRLHGACIGAGIEIPSFAHRLVAARDTVIQLPELAMGLVPGAGGTVGITARIGRWRTAYLALTGARLDPATALDWGLVDALAGG